MEHLFSRPSFGAWDTAQGAYGTDVAMIANMTRIGKELSDRLNSVSNGTIGGGSRNKDRWTVINQRALGIIRSEGRRFPIVVDCVQDLTENTLGQGMTVSWAGGSMGDEPGGVGSRRGQRDGLGGGGSINTNPEAEESARDRKRRRTGGKKVSVKREPGATSRSSGKRGAKALLRRYMETEFIPFAKQAFTRALEEGYVAYTLVRSDVDPSMMRPLVLREDSYIAAIRWQGGHRRVYEVYEMDTLVPMVADVARGVPVPKPSTRCYVEPVEMWEPSFDGMLNSPVALAMSTVSSLATLWRNYELSVQHYCKPLVLFKNVPESNRASSNDPMQHGIISPDDVAVLHAQARSADQRSEMSRLLDVQKATQILQRNVPNVSIVHSEIKQDYQITPNASLWENTYTHPLGYQFDATITPTPIPDFLEVTRERRQEIMEIIGVPSESKFGGSFKYVGTTANALEKSNHKIQTLKALMAPVFSRILERSMAELLEEDAKVVEFDETQRRTSGSLGQDERRWLRTNVISGSLEVSLNFSPLTTQETLQNLRDNHVISDKFCRQSMASLAGIPSTEVLEEDEVLAEIKQMKTRGEALLPPEALKPPKAPPAAPAGGGTAPKPAPPFDASPLLQAVAMTTPPSSSKSTKSGKK